MDVGLDTLPDDVGALRALLLAEWIAADETLGRLTAETAFPSRSAPS